MIIDTNFQTPIPVAKYMVNMVPKDAKTILEPTKGIGNISNLLIQYDLTTPEDFFLLEKQRFDCIVTNPPFSSKYAFMDNAPANFEEKGMRLGYYILRECMEMSDNIIALMPWFTISDSDVRLRFLKSFGIKSLTALPRKTFEYARIQTVVIELSKGHKKPTIFKTFDFKKEVDPKQKRLFR
jgi:type I restriction-modification system DNA methylase subunit